MVSLTNANILNDKKYFYIIVMQKLQIPQMFQCSSSKIHLSVETKHFGQK